MTRDQHIQALLQKWNDSMLNPPVHPAPKRTRKTLAAVALGAALLLSGGVVAATPVAAAESHSASATIKYYAVCSKPGRTIGGWFTEYEIYLLQLNGGYSCRW